jgi:hypothetical protein
MTVLQPKTCGIVCLPGQVVNLFGRRGGADCQRRLLRIHGDPFNRLLIAQAFEEPPRLLTHDGVMAGDGESIIAF